MRVKFTRRSRRLLDKQIDYIEFENPQASQRVHIKILRTINLLENNPYLGKVSFQEDVREILEPKYKFKIFYTIKNDTVHILAILSTKMNIEIEIKKLLK